MLILSEYLSREVMRPYALGSADCMTLVAGWVRARRGVNPMGGCAYASAGEALALMSGWGGVARTVGRAMRAAGLRMTREPQAGDVGLVVRNSVAMPAIRASRGWVCRLDDGLALLSGARVVAAWSV